MRGNAVSNSNRFNMLYPKHTDAYPNVYQKETDVHLPKRPDNRLRYVYFKTIAKGGTCIISSCKDLHLRRTVCYKALKPELADNPVEQARFLREARITAMLQHPNTMPTYELGRDIQGHYYFTMKLVHGFTLREIIDECQRVKSHDAMDYNLVELIHVVSQVCHALHYAHSHGVVHRDIKPENVLVGAFGEVLVLDWGTAKVWQDDARTGSEPHELTAHEKLEKIDIYDEAVPLTRRGPLQGTPPYMSPEQLEHPETVDHQSDIYSVGTVLFEILALERMVPGETVLEVVEYIHERKERSAREYSPHLSIPEVLDQICSKCTNWDRSDRYSSLETVIEELESWMHAEHAS